MQQDLLDLCARALSEAVLRSGRTLTMQRPSTQSAHRDLAHATASLLGSRFAAPLSLRDIAREVHSSPYHLSRIFRREMGLSIHRYLNRIRLRVAVDRLASGEPDLTILALDLGFSSRGHFYDAFRAELHVTPSALRRELCRRT
jgi:AraC family transcriptional regulator